MTPIIKVGNQKTRHISEIFTENLLKFPLAVNILIA